MSTLALPPSQFSRLLINTRNWYRLILGGQCEVAGIRKMLEVVETSRFEEISALVRKDARYRHLALLQTISPNLREKLTTEALTTSLDP